MSGAPPARDRDDGAAARRPARAARAPAGWRRRRGPHSRAIRSPRARGVAPRLLREASVDRRRRRDNARPVAARGRDDPLARRVVHQRQRRHRLRRVRLPSRRPASRTGAPSARSSRARRGRRRYSQRASMPSGHSMSVSVRSNFACSTPVATRRTSRARETQVDRHRARACANATWNSGLREGSRGTPSASTSCLERDLLVRERLRTRSPRPLQQSPVDRRARTDRRGTRAYWRRSR